MTTDLISSRLSHRETKGDKTRKRIVEAALAEFRLFGVDKANINKISNIAGVSRPTFYFHFPTKDHVLLELQRNLELPIIILIEKTRSLEKLFEIFTDNLLEARKKVGDTMLFSEMLRIYTRNAQKDFSQDQPMMEAIYKHFCKGAENGELRSGIEPMQATILYLTAVFGYLIGQSESVSEDQSKESLMTLSRLFLA